MFTQDVEVIAVEEGVLGDGVWGHTVLVLSLLGRTASTHLIYVPH